MLFATTDSHFSPQKILLPIDFSPSSHRALEAGMDLARHFRAELVLLTVVPMFSADKISDEFISSFAPDSVRIDDLRHLAKIVTVLKSQGIQATSVTEVGEDVVGNIMLTLQKQQIDLLIISTHGRTGWREAILGSIAEKVIRQVECPVLLLPTVKPGVKTHHKKMVDLAVV
jgi:nucleotide-binding universal stress UspA family protein